MKRYLIALLILSFIPLFSIPTKGKIEICRLCELIHERYYFMLRLEKMIRFFEKYEQKYHDLLPITFTEYNQFNHPRIIKLMQEVDKKNSLLPMMTLWQQLQNYKFITDEKIVKEFAKCTFLVIKKICPSFPKHKNHFFKLSDIAFNLKKGTYIEAVTLRSYYAKRLQSPLKLLSSLHCKRDRFFEKSSRHNCHCIFESKIKLKHPAIKRCINRMCETNSLKPLLDLSHEFERFRLIQDDLFSKEFLLLVFGVYKNLTINAKSSRTHKSTLEFVAQLYEKLDSLPLEEILDAIDLLSEELPQIIEEYQLKLDMDWKKWLKKHWWVPPVVMVTLGIKLYLIFKQGRRLRPNYFGFSPPPNPSPFRPNHAPPPYSN